MDSCVQVGAELVTCLFAEKRRALDKQKRDITALAGQVFSSLPTTKAAELAKGLILLYRDGFSR